MNNIKLSILIPSTHTRYDNFNIKIQDQLYSQYNKLNAFEQSQVEIIMLVDNKKMMLGEKRNRLVDLAQGDYVCHVDSDDRIRDTYIIDILEAIKHGTDVITFTCSVSLNGETPKPCFYSKDFKKDYNTEDAYFRIPNHICCIKKDVSLKSSFPNLLYREDSGFSKLLLPHIKTEYKIDKVLYYYDYNQETTETQQHMSASLRISDQKPIVDVVILSKASSSSFKRMTQRTIDTCISGANSLPINIIVIEQEPKIIYKNAKTINNQNTFNYNSFANQGIRLGKSEWVMVANSDLIFEDGWLHELLAVGHPIMSPKCSKSEKQKEVKENEIGVVNGRNLSGWAFIMKRSLWEEIGGLDEDFAFYCADDSLIEQVVSKGVEPMLVTSSIVHHLGSTTFKTIPRNKWDEMTWAYVHKFNVKYNKEKFIDNPQFNRWKIKNKID